MDSSTKSLGVATAKTEILSFTLETLRCPTAKRVALLAATTPSSILTLPQDWPRTVLIYLCSATSGWQYAVACGSSRTRCKFAHGLGLLCGVPWDIERALIYSSAGGRGRGEGGATTRTTRRSLAMDTRRAAPLYSTTWRMGMPHSTDSFSTLPSSIGACQASRSAGSSSRAPSILVRLGVWRDDTEFLEVVGQAHGRISFTHSSLSIRRKGPCTRYL